MSGPNRGKIPSELGWLIDLLDGYGERLSTLEAPDGAQVVQARKKLLETIAALEVAQDEIESLVSGLNARITAFIDNDVSAMVEAKVEAALAAKLAGDVAIGGTLSVAGRVTAPDIFSHLVTASGRPRQAVWVDSSGEMGRT